MKWASNWTVRLALWLLLLSAATYGVQIMLFHRVTDTFYYMVQDLAFVPVQVLLVTCLINDLLSRREKRERLLKMNMAIGAFFSDVGTSLLRRFARYDHQADAALRLLDFQADWSATQLAALRAQLGRHECQVADHPAELADLKRFLGEKKGFLLLLLENPILLEHESFTDLLWAVMHLAEELGYRENLAELTQADRQHLAGDANRAYSRLVGEWLAYVQHLKQAYPYIHSLVVRMNPFDAAAHAEFR